MNIMNKFILALIFLPAISHAEEKISLCGLVFNQNSMHNQVDQKGSGYSMRVDCNRNQKFTSTDPLVIINKISSARKGWITRFTQNAVAAAAERGDANARNQAPYVCMDVTVNENPCQAETQNASIISIQKMTVANIGSYVQESKSSNQ